MSRTEEKLNQLILDIENNKSIHELFENIYPLVLVSSDEMELYGVNEISKFNPIRTDKRYEYISQDIMAVLPYEHNNGKMTAVVKRDALDSIEGRIGIQHEFVHCYQVEKNGKEYLQRLDVYKRALERTDNMWELTYPFPYGDSVVKEYLIALSKFDFKSPDTTQDILIRISELSQKVSNHDLEYMIWQMWIEGFARYIENLIREKNDLKYNYIIYGDKIERHIFYQIGDHFFRSINETNIDIDVAFEMLHDVCRKV